MWGFVPITCVAVIVFMLYIVSCFILVYYFSIFWLFFITPFPDVDGLWDEGDLNCSGF